MQKGHLLRAVVVGAFAATGALVVMAACSSSSTPSADAGVDGGGTVRPHDAGITQFEAAAPDSFILLLPEASIPDTGTIDATVSAPDSGPADATADHAVSDAADAHRVDTGASPDTGVKDTGVDAPVQFDTGTCVAVGVPNTTAGAGQCTPPEAGACGPAVLSGFTPTPPRPQALQDVCSAAQIQSIYNDCLVGDTCPESDTGNGALACYNCIFSSASSQAWAPVVLTGGIANINTGGCLEILEPCNTDCAQAIEDDFLCDQQACGTNCPVTEDAGSLTAFTNCASAADNCDPGGCYLYGNAAYGATGCINQIVNLPASHPGSICFQESFESAFLSVSGVFCGGMP